MSERTPEQIVELLKKGHRVRKPPEEEIEELEQRIAELTSWIKAANQFAWVHETDCPGRKSGSLCTCGLDQFLGRPRPFVESYKDRIAELEGVLRRHHQWQLDVGSATFRDFDPNGDGLTVIETEINLTEAYVESSLYEETTAAISKPEVGS